MPIIFANRESGGTNKKRTYSEESICFTGPSSLLRELPFLLYQNGYSVEFQPKPKPESVEMFSNAISMRIKKGFRDVTINAAEEGGQVQVFIISDALVFRAGSEKLRQEIISLLKKFGLLDPVG